MPPWRLDRCHVRAARITRRQARTRARSGPHGRDSGALHVFSAPCEVACPAPAECASLRRVPQTYLVKSLAPTGSGARGAARALLRAQPALV